VSGYAKRMMEIAGEWLATNPDSSTSAINLPRELDHILKRPLFREDQIDALKAKARASGRTDALAQLDELDAKLAELRAGTKEIESLTHEVRDYANAAYRLCSAKWERTTGEDALHYANEARWLLAWARDGHNVFDLSPDFVAAMLLTDPAEIDLPTLKLPFRGLLLMIPDRFATGAEGTSYTKIHVVETDDSRIFDGPEAPPNTGEKRPAIAIYATDGAHVLSTVTLRSDLSWAALEELPDEVDFVADREAQKTIQRIAFGALAYVTAVDRAITERFPEQGKKRKPGAAAIAHWTIGREVKIDPELVRTARAGAREIAFRIKSRFVVRGHYRNQAHGPGRSLRTSKWIMPHWKGPQEGARLVHTYKPEAPAKEIK